MKSSQKLAISILLIGLASQLTACFPLLATGVVTGALVTTDRRSPGTILDDQNIEMKINSKVLNDGCKYWKNPIDFLKETYAYRFNWQTIPQMLRSDEVESSHGPVVEYELDVLLGLIKVEKALRDKLRLESK